MKRVIVKVKNSSDADKLIDFIERELPTAEVLYKKRKCRKTNGFYGRS